MSEFLNMAAVVYTESAERQSFYAMPELRPLVMLSIIGLVAFTLYLVKRK